MESINIKLKRTDWFPVDKECQVIWQYWSQTFLLPLLKKSLNIDPSENAFKNNGSFFFFFFGEGRIVVFIFFFVSAHHYECLPESSFMMFGIRIELNSGAI